MGGLPNVYPAYQVVTDDGTTEEIRKRVAMRNSPTKSVYTIMEMMHGLEDGSVKALVVLGENPVGSDPDANHVKHALESAEFLAVIDIFLTDTAKLAHVVLPGACFCREGGDFFQYGTQRASEFARRWIP